MSIDFLILSLLVLFWVYNDMVMWKWFDKGIVLLLLLFVFFFGFVLYFVFRFLLLLFMVEEES